MCSSIVHMLNPTAERWKQTCLTKTKEVFSSKYALGQITSCFGRKTVWCRPACYGLMDCKQRQWSLFTILTQSNSINLRNTYFNITIG